MIYTLLAIGFMVAIFDIIADLFMAVTARVKAWLSHDGGAKHRDYEEN